MGEDALIVIIIGQLLIQTISRRWFIIQKLLTFTNNDIALTRIVMQFLLIYPLVI